ncbi:polyadenylation and cleavage factor homolog 4 isoform X2 [Vigna radiata var. radiata]|uniref:Polyadenylation and cleavage factor homolog 4 isoform X2 n=1 Tax=Vigna radiata var. radiata TaxID=3916 RepID=A0A1S3V547_VIGRR|nr:polyadenylation and cleavage factor homolog 4 isoform X2 [Vigna radiata var. radiata]XP_014513471.1 polyadenylation and cleavage factor homolog 4 isoform X2 [Vigna radiata var. radiata]XP_014513474.1 polyadenylation and cleavage factor homolog 4 isoform X2 [Vigna radiata var. radiata]XP_022640358.1 polyadenylation and cleavage factor homolog 4 isoform X2 [Vigna radiata var. radiata]
MENSRRLFDRSREPGPKKPRLMEELDRAPNSGARQFPQLQVISGASTLPSARFRTNERDVESNEFGRRGGAGGGGYQPQPLPFQELVTQYKAALAELTFNSKPIITNLTIIAGENQAAEKAIAATVCANILEVPSDQKLPSLYLLDSIVKNIGRDYIKYFAARLPEVFCKAYRQVDPSVHQSMRHLFGTWKGVFPPQTLQIIEKELGFTSAVNGSSASSTLRSDSQSQRPPHSIHVNPKYLERQRLQQSSRTKGVDDMTGAISNSNDDQEIPGRTLGVLRSWVDHNVTVSVNARENDHRARRDAFNDSVPEKSTSASYGSNELGSNISRNIGLGISRPSGRVTESGHDKGWYNKSGVAAGTMPGQRNGLSHKYSFSSTEAPKSMVLDAHHQPAHNITSTQSSVISNSWKNSEEEEYTWDEMNSGLTGHGTSIVSSLSKDAWTADDENLEVEDRIQVRNPFVVNADRELAIESQANEKKQFPASQHHSSLSWPLQEQHSIHELNRKAGHSSRFVSTLGAIPTNTNASTARMGSRPFLSSATIGLPGIAGPFHSLGAENPSGQSPLQRRSPSPPGPFSSMTFQARHQQQLGTSLEVTVKTEKPPVSKVPLVRETKSSMSTGNLPTRLGVRPSRTGGPSPATLISSVSTSALPSSLGPSGDNSSALSKMPQRKAGQPPRLSTLPSASSNVSSASAQTSDTSNNLNPIANLLSSLVAKGLISAETESTSKVPSELLNRLEEESDSITTGNSLPVASISGSAAVPVPSIKDEVDDTARTPLSLSESTSPGVVNLIGFEFKHDVLREFHSSVISGLFDDLPHHCSICGFRLRFQKQFNRHLEWHATRDREENGLTKASRWYLKSSDWIVGKAEYVSENEADSVDTYGNEADRSQEDAMVVADENQCLCVLCGELFEDFYCEESGEWMFKGAVYFANSDSNSEMGTGDMGTRRGPIIHANCLSDNLISCVPEMGQD